MRITRKTALATVLATIGATLFMAAPAHAATFTYTCFKYTGTFRSGSHIKWGDWNSDGRGDECFGIGTDRRIFHAWANSGGWKVMPNSGLADDVLYALPRSSSERSVAVHTNSSGNYYSVSDSGSAWKGWYRCDSTCSWVS